MVGAVSPLVQKFIDNPEWALECLEQEAAERSLHEFIRQTWGWFDSATFKDNWHIGAICEHLEAVTHGEIRRLIINVPPRSMKSLGVCVAWPAWMWIHKPEHKFMFATYAERLSIEHSMKCRYLINSPVYQKRWGGIFRLAEDQNTKGRFDNDKLGYRMATSVGGALTGFGGDTIVIDDPINPSEAASEIQRGERTGLVVAKHEHQAERCNDRFVRDHHAKDSPARFDGLPARNRSGKLGTPMLACKVRR